VATPLNCVPEHACDDSTLLAVRVHPSGHTQHVPPLMGSKKVPAGHAGSLACTNLADDQGPRMRLCAHALELVTAVNVRMDADEGQLQHVPPLMGSKKDPEGQLRLATNCADEYERAWQALGSVTAYCERSYPAGHV